MHQSLNVRKHEKLIKKRRVAETIELDLSLRTARNLYTVVAIIAVPAAAFSAIWMMDSIPQIVAHLLGDRIQAIGSAIWDAILGLIAILFAAAVVAQTREARRRIKLLSEDPSAPVKPMYVPEFLRKI